VTLRLGVIHAMEGTISRFSEGTNNPFAESLEPPMFRATNAPARKNVAPFWKFFSILVSRNVLSTIIPTT
jgi:hypothetical protein